MNQLLHTKNVCMKSAGPQPGGHIQYSVPKRQKEFDTAPSALFHPSPSLSLCPLARKSHKKWLLIPHDGAPADFLRAAVAPHSVLPASTVLFLWQTYSLLVTLHLLCPIIANSFSRLFHAWLLLDIQDPAWPTDTLPPLHYLVSLSSWDLRLPASLPRGKALWESSPYFPQ